MPVDTVLDLTKPEIVRKLQEMGPVVHTLVPEFFKFTEDNIPGKFPHPILVRVARNGILYMLDYKPLDKTSQLIKVQLHNPVRTTILKSKIMCTSFCVLDEVLYLCTRED